MELSNQNLHKLVVNIAERVFGMHCDARVMYNPRLRTTGGRYYRKKNLIQINPKMLTVYGKVIFVATIKHELCHYKLVHLEHRIGRYQGHDKKFWSLCRKVGGVRYAPNPNEALWIYQCEKCGRIYYMDKPARYQGHTFAVCQCHGELKLLYKNQLADDKLALFNKNPKVGMMLVGMLA